MPDSPNGNPYVVGGWVSGPRFYGHADLINDLLNSADNYLWVIGTRRVGKTSLLRQLKLTAAEKYISLYWDLQGCQSEQDLRDELHLAIEEQAQRLSEIGIDSAALAQDELKVQIHKLCLAAANQGARILLLIDEPEALIDIVQKEPVAIQRLRAALQRHENLRVVLASTKLITRIDDLSSEWLTSHFLHGFSPRRLAGLTGDDAAALIRQSHGDRPVKASDATVDAIRQHTNNHPYLIQWLCYRLYEDKHSLRPPTDADITLDAMLDSLFALIYKQLSPTERRIVLALAETDGITTGDLVEQLGVSEPEISMYLYAMTSLGYTRNDGQRAVIGNTFLKRWLEAYAHSLAIGGAEVTDSAVQEVAAAGREQEVTYLQEQLQVYRNNLGKLEVDSANYGMNPPLQLQTEIDFHKRKIRELEDRLDLLAQFAAVEPDRQQPPSA